MRSIDIRGLKGLGKRGAGPWRLGEDRLVRTASGNKPLCSSEEAFAQFQVYNAAHASGAGTPAALEIVRLEGVAADAPSLSGAMQEEAPENGAAQDAVYGVVVEYVAGVPLTTHVVLGSFDPEEAGFAVGRIQRRLHDARMQVGLDWNAEFRLQAHRMERFLPRALGRKLVALVQDVPARDALLHGDLHLNNVVVSKGEPALIDMEFAGYGNPAIDLAISRLRTADNAVQLAEHMGMPQDQVLQLARQCWEAQLRGYLGDPSPAQLAEADRRLAILAELGRCAFDIAPSRAAADAPPASFDASIAMLADALPHASRLDLGDLIPGVTRRSGDGRSSFAS